MTLFDYRLIQMTYYNYIYQEEPGGITDVAAKSTRYIVWERRNAGEDFRRDLLKEGVHGSENSDDGRIEYWYFLERRPAGTSDEWTFAGNLKVKRQDDDDWYEEDEGGY